MICEGANGIGGDSLQVWSHTICCPQSNVVSQQLCHEAGLLEGVRRQLVHLQLGLGQGLPSQGYCLRTRNHSSALGERREGVER